MWMVLIQYRIRWVLGSKRSDEPWRAFQPHIGLALHQGRGRLWIMLDILIAVSAVSLVIMLNRIYWRRGKKSSFTFFHPFW